MHQFIEVMNCGGAVNWILYVLAILLFERFLHLFFLLNSMSSFVNKREKEFFKDIYKCSLKNKNDRKVLNNCFREFFLKEIKPIKYKVDILFALVAAAPLLGLLGTVVGMIKTFRLITEFGFGNPDILSEGISVSLLTTEAGLLVAFPGLLMANKIKQKSKKVMSDIMHRGNVIINGRLKSV